MWEGLRKPSCPWPAAFLWVAKGTRGLGLEPSTWSMSWAFSVAVSGRSWPSWLLPVPQNLPVGQARWDLL